MFDSFDPWSVEAPKNPRQPDDWSWLASHRVCQTRREVQETCWAGSLKSFAVVFVMRVDYDPIINHLSCRVLYTKRFRDSLRIKTKRHLMDESAWQSSSLRKLFIFGTASHFGLFDLFVLILILISPATYTARIVFGAGGGAKTQKRMLARRPKLSQQKPASLYLTHHRYSCSCHRLINFFNISRRAEKNQKRNEPEIIYKAIRNMCRRMRTGNRQFSFDDVLFNMK